jgi:hypothetical protein
LVANLLNSLLSDIVCDGFNYLKVKDT